MGHHFRVGALGLMAVTLLAGCSVVPSFGSRGVGDPSGLPLAVAPTSPSPSTGSASGTTERPAAGKKAAGHHWHALDGALGDPVYVTLLDYRAIADGSVTLKVDAWSPDFNEVEGVAGQDCRPFIFYQPSGEFCLTNLSERRRLVTLIPGADVGWGDTTVPFEYLWRWVMSGKTGRNGVVFLRLDERGFARSIVAYRN